MEKSLVILEGRSNKHVLVGDFLEKKKSSEYGVVLDNRPKKTVTINKAKLYHKDDNDNFAEHGTLVIPKGTYQIFNQIEYNPFTRSISGIWD